MLLHGYGDDPADLAALTPRLDPEGRFTTVVPRAPFDGPGGPAWFESDADGPDPRALTASLTALDRLIDNRCRALAADPAATVVVGYSQGAAVALALALRSGAPRRPAGVAAVAGFLLHAEGLEWAISEAAPTTAALLVHGADDDIVAVQQGRSAARVLARSGMAVTWREFDGGHAIGPETVEALQTWLAAVADGRRPDDPPG